LSATIFGSEAASAYDLELLLEEDGEDCPEEEGEEKGSREGIFEAEPDRLQAVSTGLDLEA